MTLAEADRILQFDAGKFGKIFLTILPFLTEVGCNKSISTRRRCLGKKMAARLAIVGRTAHESSPIKTATLPQGFPQELLLTAVKNLTQAPLKQTQRGTINPHETVTLVDKTNAPVVIQRTERLTSILTRDHDNVFNASFGLRVAASEKLLLLGNVVVPLNDGGLRSNVVPTFGATVSF
ncbi:MAG: hypothetical protein ONB46_05685 [candidate division KSB1 bacterium]|nr:hypothetical protein [candidate division KSB1 bacterium]MDZ7365403.1 hypothetical protein [candidate division KSB1 bacterium]MDZ7403550.1 hypothetical protein [candidate division KSB1 bacterium]